MIYQRISCVEKLSTHPTTVRIASIYFVDDLRRYLYFSSSAKFQGRLSTTGNEKNKEGHLRCMLRSATAFSHEYVRFYSNFFNIMCTQQGRGFRSSYIIHGLQ